MLPTVLKERSDAIREQFGLPEVTLEKVMYNGMGTTRMSDHRAVVGDNGRLYEIMSGAYRLAKHQDGLAVLEHGLRQVPDVGPIDMKVVGFDDFRRLRATFRMPELRFTIVDEINHSRELPAPVDPAHDFTPGSVGKRGRVGDVINPTIEYFNSYDGSWSERIIMGAYRLVCMNGAVVGVSYLHERFIHLGDEHSTEQLVELVAASVQRFGEQARVWDTWSRTQASQEQIEDILNLFGPSIADDLKLRLDTMEDLTLWDLFNFATNKTTHHIGSLNRRVEVENKLRQVTDHWPTEVIAA